MMDFGVRGIPLKALIKTLQEIPENENYYIATNSRGNLSLMELKEGHDSILVGYIDLYNELYYPLQTELDQC